MSFLDKILNGEGISSKTSEIEDRYDELIKVEKMGEDDLYSVYEYDKNKGSRILYLNLRTKSIIREKKIPITIR